MIVRFNEKASYSRKIIYYCKRLTKQFRKIGQIWKVTLTIADKLNCSHYASLDISSFWWNHNETMIRIQRHDKYHGTQNRKVLAYFRYSNSFTIRGPSILNNFIYRKKHFADIGNFIFINQNWDLFVPSDL